MSYPFFSLITPTIQRQSIRDLYDSITGQSFTDWEWIIQVDGEGIDSEVFEGLKSFPNISIDCCGKRHNNSGNTCRHLAWNRANGTWVIGIDDDNIFCDAFSLERLAKSLHSVETPWALIPIFRFGNVFLNDPPGLCQTDTANMVIRREFAQWPDIPDYTADGIFADHLRSKYPYTVLRNLDPIIFMDRLGKGEM